MWGYHIGSGRLAAPAPNTIHYSGRGLGDELQWFPLKTEYKMVRGMRWFFLFFEGFST